MSDDAPDVATATTAEVRGDRGLADDPTRTSAAHDESAPAPVLASAREDRLPAPLQYRDPERYEIVGEHGRGGLGRVLRARDRELGRDVAVKELLTRGNTSELRFFREALITARLEHPGIVPVHEAGRWPDGTPFYAMKLVQGRPLRDLIEDCKTLDERLALMPHLIAVTDAIAYAHARKIIHRDLKPSNVIVGSYGETVVIDWGLAKDLTSEIADPIDEGPFRTPPQDGITVAGSVLGTPAYMAPEQQGGKADERADIYALGGVIFHALVGRPPHAKGRLAEPPPAIARAIPRDLAAIVRRAMAPDPADRYQRAQDLAADLRRFTQRRPVAARRYSLVGRALLAFVRHRATSLVAVLALAVLSIVLAVDHYRVEQQRGRAIASEARTRDALGQLTLKHAEVLMSSDPSAALDALDTYTGPDHEVAARLRAEAIGRGVSTIRSAASAGTIVWLHGAGDGAVLALSNDGAIAKVEPSGAAHVLATGGTPRNVFAYSGALGVLAYACDPADVCLFDTVREQRAATSTALKGVTPEAMAMSPHGRLAVLGQRGAVSMWDVSNVAAARSLLQRHVDGAQALVFPDDDHVLVVAKDTLTVLSPSAAPGSIALSGVAAWDAAADQGIVVVGTSSGELADIDIAGARIVHRVPACDGPVSSVRVLPRHGVAAFACRSGAIATWTRDDARPSVLAHLAESPDLLEVDPSGEALIAGGDAGAVLVVDMQTGLTTSYLGHHARISALDAGLSPRPFLVSGDEHGHVRSWPAPRRIARRVMQQQLPMREVTFLGDSDSLVATGVTGELYASVRGATATTYGPHEATNVLITAAPARSRFATFGLSGHVEIWSAQPLAPERTLDTPHGTVSQVIFLADGTIATSGRDGQLLLWSPDGTAQRLLKLDHPLTGMVFVPERDVFVVKTNHGEVWRVGRNGASVRLRSAGAAVTMLQVSANGRWVAAGDADGRVEMFDTTTWEASTILRASGSVRHIVFSPSGDEIAIASKDGVVHLSKLRGDSTTVAWTDVAVPARYLAFSPTGDLLMIACADGAVWFRSSRGQWAYVFTGAADISFARVAPDGHRAATTDFSGRVLLFDLDAIRHGP